MFHAFLESISNCEENSVLIDLKDQLIFLFNTKHKWDVIDIVIQSNPQSYYIINDIYNQCLNKTNTSTSFLKNLGLIVNVISLFLSYYYYFQFTLAKYVPIWASMFYKARLSSKPNITYSEFKQELEIIAWFYSFMSKVLNIPLYLQVFSKHLFKSEAFNQQFNEQVATHICDLIKENPFILEAIQSVLQ